MEIERRGRCRAAFLFYWGLAAVALLSFCVYLGILQHYFVADDFIFLKQFHLEKPAFLDSFAYFGRDWGTGSLFYRPLIRVVWAAEYGFFGTNPVGWHLVSLLLYSANTALVYFLTWLLSQNLGVAFFAGLLFSLHPIHCEPVAWISDQTDLLAALFCLASIILYLQAQRSIRNARRLLLVNYSLALGCFILALTSKESAISFFLIPLAYELVHSLFSLWGAAWRYVQRNLLRIALWQIPFWVTIALYIKLRFTLFGGMGGYSGNKPVEIKLTSTELLLYIRWLFNPLNPELVEVNYFLLAAVLLFSLTVLGCVFVWQTRQMKVKRTNGRKPESSGRAGISLACTALFSLCWIVVFILPTLTASSPRLMYLATIGVAIFVAVVLAPLGPIVAQRNFTTRPLGLLGTAKLQIVPLNCLKLMLVASFLVLSAQGTLTEQNLWWQASQITRTTLRQLPEIYPNLKPHSQVYVVGLMNIPQPGHSAALVYGFPEAVQLIYNNPTLWGFSVDQFPVNQHHQNHSYFVEYRDGRLVPRQDLLPKYENSGKR